MMEHRYHGKNRNDDDDLDSDMGGVNNDNNDDDDDDDDNNNNNKNNGTTTTTIPGKKMKLDDTVDTTKTKTYTNSKNVIHSHASGADVDVDGDGGDSDTDGQPQPQHHQQQQQKSLHIAPMIHVTTREFRHLVRILSKRCVLWTEMVVDETVYYCARQPSKRQQPSPTTSNSTAAAPAGTAASTNYTYNKAVMDVHLGYDAEVEHPIVCQLGGIRPEHTSFATQLIVGEGIVGQDTSFAYRYDEINLNMGCPSERVSTNKGFGAALMRPQHRARACALLHAMQQNNSSLPRRRHNVSVKLRIGIVDKKNHESKNRNNNNNTNTNTNINDDNETEETNFDYIRNLIEELYQRGNGCTKFYLHARKVYLTGGVNPAQNRSIPPLNYPMVYRLCHAFPACTFILNGGITSLRTAKAIVYGKEAVHDNDDTFEQHAVPCTLCNYTPNKDTTNGSCVVIPTKGTVPQNLVGCMIGRAIRDNPCLLWDCDRYFYNAPEGNPCRTRRHVLDQYIRYLESRHPPRCCDTDTDTENAQDYGCSRCSGWRQSMKHYPGSPTKKYKTTSGTNIDIATTTKTKTKQKKTTTNNSNKTQTPNKITSHTIRRSLQPVLGIFYGLRGKKYGVTKKFRRQCEVLVQTPSIRDCGPGYCLIRALYETPVSDDILDLEFVPN